LERLALFALPDIEIDVKDQDVSERSSDTNLAVERRGRRDSISGDFSQEETVAFAEILDSKTGKLENLGVPPDTRNITLALEATKHKEQGHLDIWQWLSHAQAYEIEDDESELTKDNKLDRTSVRLDDSKCYSPQEALNHSQPINAKTPAQLASNMTLIYKDQSRLKEAEDIAVQAMEKCTTVLGTNHPDTLMSMANLASIYQDQNRWQEAEELESQVLGLRHKAFGAHHPETLSSMAKLAFIRKKQGQFEQAEQLLVLVVERKKMVLGPEHPDTLTSMASLVLLYQDQNQWQEAGELQLQVLDIRKRVFGAHHPETLSSMAKLALIRKEQGQFEQAEQLLVQVVESYNKWLRPDHPRTLEIMDNLAITWELQGRHENALALMKDCLQARQQVLGLDHPDTKRSSQAVQDWSWKFSRNQA
jgi:tetratricopeptide (TPR) repeat protein